MSRLIETMPQIRSDALLIPVNGSKKKVNKQCKNKQRHVRNIVINKSTKRRKEKLGHYRNLKSKLLTQN